GRHITSFVALSTKMYSFVVDNDTSQLNNKVKGIKSYKKHSLTHALYQQAHREQKLIKVTQTLMQSREHTIHTITQRKRALSVWEDKRIWVSANVSYPYGHHRLPELLAAAAAASDVTDPSPAAKRQRL
ncbi:MAG: hypothetical protein AAGJ80_01980, partial [Cyanobacteria bacterium J06553_1]